MVIDSTVYSNILVTVEKKEDKKSQYNYKCYFNDRD